MIAFFACVKRLRMHSLQLTARILKTKRGPSGKPEPPRIFLMTKASLLRPLTGSQGCISRF